MIKFKQFIIEGAPEWDDHLANTCATLSIAHVTGHDPAKVWEHSRKYYKTRKGRYTGMHEGHSHLVLQALGHEQGLGKHRWDMMWHEGPRQVHAFGSSPGVRRTRTLGEVRKMVAAEPHKKFFISTNRHMMAAKEGKIYDPAGKTHDRTKIHHVYEFDGGEKKDN